MTGISDRSTSSSKSVSLATLATLGCSSVFESHAHSDSLDVVSCAQQQRLRTLLEVSTFDLRFIFWHAMSHWTCITEESDRDGTHKTREEALLPFTRATPLAFWVHGNAARHLLRGRKEKARS